MTRALPKKDLDIWLKGQHQLFQTFFELQMAYDQAAFPIFLTKFRTSLWSVAVQDCSSFPFVLTEMSPNKSLACLILFCSLLLRDPRPTEVVPEMTQENKGYSGDLGLAGSPNIECANKTAPWLTGGTPVVTGTDGKGP